MNRTEVNAVISARLWNKGGLKGAVYGIWINGWQIPCNALKEVRKRAVEGDSVRVKIWWGRRGEMDFQFVILPNDLLVDIWKDQRGKTNADGAPRDTNRQKVYNWERSNFPKGRELSLSQIDTLVSEIYDTYGFSGKEPIVKSSYRHKDTSTYYPMYHEIRLAAGWGHKKMTVLHEVAHDLINSMGLTTKVASHGKEFVSLFMELSELWLTMDNDQVAQARSKGVKLGTVHSFRQD